VSHAQAALGLLVFFGLAWALSERRDAVHPRVMIAGIVVQLLLAALLLKVDPLRAGFDVLGEGVRALQRASEAGSGFVFGYLGGAPLPFEERTPGAGFVLAFRALPLILVLSALTALLTHWRVLPALVRALATGLRHSLGIGAATGLGVAANVFLGMVEAPLFIRPWLARLTRSELFVLMTAGMATIAGTVMVLYASVLGDAVPGAAGHLLTASIISAPAAVAVALVMVPETESPTDAATVALPRYAGAMDAVVQGTEAGLRLLLAITALLVVLVALVHLVNALLGLLPEVAGAALTLERALGWLMRPVVWLMGVPWSEAAVAGGLMGVKTVLNEFLAYLQLAALPADALGERGRVIMTYALCGFANPGSLGILVGGLSALVPERRAEIVGLGLRSVLSGTLATCSTGAVVALVGA
jgi:CNT family concentrative nucleoside transporter